MDAVEQNDPLWNEQEKQRHQPKIGGQSMPWRRRGESTEQQALAEPPHGETAGSPQFKRARLEEFLETEQEKTGEDETELIGPEGMLMTKSEGEPSSSTASSTLDKRQYDREISFHQLPEGDVPLHQEAERAQWDEWVTHGSDKIPSPVEAAKIRQHVPRERRLHSRFAHRNKNARLLDPAGNPLPMKAKARLVTQGVSIVRTMLKVGENRCFDSATGLR